MNIRERHRTYLRVAFDSEEREIELLFVDRYVQGLSLDETTALVYLHRVRQLGASHSWIRRNEQFYQRTILPKATAVLAELLKGRRFDAVFSPPSSREDALPYRGAVLDAIGPAADWTKFFKRVSGTRAGTIQSCD